MLIYSVTELDKWMASTHTNPHFRSMIRKYLLAQSSSTMVDCLNHHDPLLHTHASVQDRLGWDNFIEGRICTVFLTYITQELGGRRRCLRPARWCMLFVKQLLQLTHKQWLFRNSHVHYKKLDGLTPAEHEKIFERVKDLMYTDPSELLAQHRYLLEEDFENLGEGSSGERQHWIASMESALKAANHVRSGKEYVGEPGAFVGSHSFNYTTALRPSSGGSYVYRRCRVKGSRHQHETL